MGLRPHLFLLGLLLLLGPGPTQAHTFLGKNTLDEQLWPELRSLRAFPFPCKPKKSESNVPAMSVHTLKPSDIKFVAAIGNVKSNDTWKPSSEEAAFLSFSEIIRHFNPSVLKPVCIPGKEVVPQISAEDLWIQAEELVENMKNNQQLDFQNDWKLINVLFSNANLCHLCPSAQQDKLVTDNMSKLTRMLDYLLQEVPKVFVNIVDLSEAVGHQGNGLSLEAEPCKCSEMTSKLPRTVMQWSYQENWEGLLNSSKYNQEDSFAVVFQPFFYETSSSPHLKELLHQDPTTLSVSLNLWNIMMQPAGQKIELFSTNVKRFIKCPSQEMPYLFTYRNSNYLPRLPEPTEKLELGLTMPLQCPNKDPSDKIPTSVHRLRVADIKVVAALGDSITAGNGAGAKTGDILDVLTEYRGLSWSIGGDEDLSSVITLPNILREFNPSLKGFSVGTGKQNSAGAFFNQAVSGAQSRDLPGEAMMLVNLMKNHTGINFKEDWKIITVFIGGNDLCDFCKDMDVYSPENYISHIKRALDFLHAEVPRAFVNLVNVLEISSLQELYNDNRVYCPRLILMNLCLCVLNFKEGSEEYTKLIEINKKYQEKIHELVNTRRYDTKDDFTVVVQPFFENVNIPKTEEGVPDSSYFAPDCFHFSKKTHGHAATALWNNMLEPIGQKATQHDFQSDINITCPSQVELYLSTFKNSVKGNGSLLPCTDLASSPTQPTSVHAVRPADIQVVAALGDSLTAGSGIRSKPSELPNLTTQYRGLSYSSGGDGILEYVTTLPNILRKFNQHLKGYALGTGDATDTKAFFNQAVPGAKAKDLVGQVWTLVQRMKENDKVNFKADWKIITVMIGGSDLCDYCTDSNLYSAVNFYEHLCNALDILHREVPRTLVNLVDFMNPAIIRQAFLGNPNKCPVKQSSSLCNCVLSPLENSEELAKLKAVTKAYQNSLRELVESGRYDIRENFSVVLQPFFSNIQLPTLQDGHPDLSFFAPDCIHPNQNFHSQLSRALWVNMLEPLGKKTDTLDLAANISLSCPTKDVPFLTTLKNSNYTYPTKPAIENWGSDFLCAANNLSTVPTSVHELRPSDIKVVAALGDSLTTAVGACPSKPNEKLGSWRGLSWSIGGDGVLENHTTLPNILKMFNPEIIGFSTGTEKETAGLNVAVEGAKAEDMPAQAKALVELMKMDPKINLEKDWKLITLFIGSNDLCHHCYKPRNYSVMEYVQHIQQALDIFYEQLPRVFINVVEVMELTGLHQGLGGRCRMPLGAQSECTCFRDSPENSPELLELKKVNKDFQSGIFQLSNQQHYLEREDFAVVVQPFFRNTIVPLNHREAADLTFFSEDCFHFSERGHAEMAIALWNNMLEPVGNKTTSNNFTYSRTKLKCPSLESPYLFTLKNSQPQKEQQQQTETKKTVEAINWAVPLAAICGFLVWEQEPFVLAQPELPK
ncbi:PREDICTED: phospholipase B1, membrane-associated [Miniopterus natalensis]|uniref:phospholipase B1, membrane-associated n=1 Tax=Miniopterus natalensis TaxID=291302 RepID=UPI0007A6F38B|nr:PREDICTED: phospholipase B1, membrane-associated [Miniopterus natalensis]